MIPSAQQAGAPKLGHYSLTRLRSPLHVEVVAERPTITRQPWATTNQQGGTVLHSRRVKSSLIKKQQHFFLHLDREWNCSENITQYSQKRSYENARFCRLFTSYLVRTLEKERQLSLIRFSYAPSSPLSFHTCPEDACAGYWLFFILFSEPVHRGPLENSVVAWRAHTKKTHQGTTKKKHIRYQ